MNKKSIKELKLSAREDRDAAYTLGRHYFLEKKKYRQLFLVEKSSRAFDS